MFDNIMQYKIILFYLYYLLSNISRTHDHMKKKLIGNKSVGRIEIQNNLFDFMMKMHFY